MSLDYINLYVVTGIVYAVGFLIAIAAFFKMSAGHARKGVTS